MRRNILGISQGAASIVALAATAIIVAIALSAQLPNLYFVQAAGSQEAGKAEKLAGVRLSLVAVLEDGTAIIANDGSDPVTIERLYTSSGVVNLASPVTIQPGQKASIRLGGQPDALAVGLAGGGIVVLKEKPGVEFATRTTQPTTTTTSRTTTASTVTSTTTVHSTAYTPFIVTSTHASLRTTHIVTTTYTTAYYYWCNPPCYRTYVYTYPAYRYVEGSGTLTTIPVARLETALVIVRTSTTTSLNTQASPPTLWYITYVITTQPSVTTVTTITTATVTLYTYTATHYFTTVAYYSTYITQPITTIGTTTATATVTVTNTHLVTTTTTIR
jgi:hypothetical protein